jgi:hypothetical protein
MRLFDADRPSAPLSGRAAALHQGRHAQPPTPVSGLAAALHQGWQHQPPAPVSGRAAALHQGRQLAAPASSDGFDWHRVRLAQRDELRRVFANICRTDPYFDTVYRVLASAHGAYGFALDPALPTNGQFVPGHRERGGTLTFRSVQWAGDPSTVNEEFFHAYQNYFYGRARMSRIGGSNIEMEPRFLEAFKQVNSGQGYIQMPGRERMFNLVFNIDERATGLTLPQSQEYLNSVKEFRQYWERENRLSNVSNKYDDPATSHGPAAAFDIINRVRKAGKK